MIIEVCIENVLNAIKAYHAGADILELCAHLDKDGLTPDINTYKTIREEVDVPIKVMIRVDNPTFQYTEFEISEMRKSVQQFSEIGAKNFVFGALDASNNIDLDATASVFKNVELKSLTIHKAIDKCQDILAACQQIKHSKIKITHILSSGGQETAKLGFSRLLEMKAILSPDIKLIAAGRITHENLDEIHQTLQLDHYHGKRILSF